MRKRLPWLIAFIFLMVGSVGTMAFYFTEYKWFQSLNYQDVFTTILFQKIILGFIGFAVTFLFVFANLKWLQKWLARIGPEDIVEPEVIQVDFGQTRQRMQGNLSEFGRTIARSPLLSWIILGFSALVSISNAIALSSQWMVIAKFLQQVPYGVSDPIFKHDVSFYLFTLPLLELILETAFGLTLFLLAVCGFFYLTNGGFRKTPLDKRPFAHLGMLGALGFVLQAGNFWIEMLNLVYSPRGVAFGASYSDIHASIPTLYIAMGISVLGAFMMLSQMARPSLRTAIVPVVLVAVIAVAGQTVVAGLIQNLQVKPNEFTMEEPYLKYNIEFTRLAYNLNNTVEIDYPIAANATADWAELNEYSTSIDTVPLLNYQQTQQAFSQLQGMRLYYKFNDVDVDRYLINNELVPVMLSARELPADALQTEANTWVNRHLKYTHGYGAVVAPSNEISSDGQPNLIVKDIPPQTQIPELAITRPEIYYGELTKDYVIVGTRSKEFDYPMGDSNAETSYEGEAGLSISSMFARLLFSIRFNTLNPLLTNEITADSKILLHRQIVERVSTIAPFLYYDSDPYLVIHEGQLMWIIDGYTISDNFPYAQSWQQDEQMAGANYIRNSVKVTINAYDGTTSFYLYDTTDPVVQTFAKIFPNLFKPMSDMPSGLITHLRYPEDMFKIQAKMLLNYHMTNTKVFYNREDVWAIAKTSGQPVESYYDIMEFPGSDQAEFMTLYPLTPSQKDNMVAFLAGVSNKDGVSSLSVYLFPKDRLVYGPAQIEARINQESNISKDLSLWNQGGSTVSKGHTITVPLKDSLLYVVPLYITSNSSSLPELKKVIVSYGNRLVMEDNLPNALIRIFGNPEGDVELPGTPVPGESADSDLKQLIQNILIQYEIVTTQRQQGNWTEYGKAMDMLEEMLNELATRDLSGVQIDIPTNGPVPTAP